MRVIIILKYLPASEKNCKPSIAKGHPEKAAFHNDHFANRADPRAESFAPVDGKKRNEDVEPRESLRRDPEHAGRINPRLDDRTHGTRDPTTRRFDPLSELVSEMIPARPTHNVATRTVVSR